VLTRALVYVCCQTDGWGRWAAGATSRLNDNAAEAAAPPAEAEVAKAALSAQPDADQARDVMPVQGLLVRCPHIPLRILCMLFRDRQLNFLLYYL
jgi:hypothetical protein